MFRGRDGWVLTPVCRPTGVVAAIRFEGWFCAGMRFVSMPSLGPLLVLVLVSNLRVFGFDVFNGRDAS